MDAGDQMDEQANYNPQPEQTMITRGPEGWSELPLVVLQNVYLFSTQTDQAAMSLVCRSWTNVFNDALLWRSRLLINSLVGDISNSERMIEIAQKLGSLVHHVEFKYAQCLDATEERTLLLSDFIGLLKSKSPLETVIFRDVSRSVGIEHDHGIRNPVVFQQMRTLFLSTNVKTARFHNLEMRIAEAAWLLSTLTAKMRCNLRHLTLENFMDRASEHASLDGVLDLNILAVFINLETFEGTYSPLFEKIIDDICKSSEEIRSYTRNMLGNLRRIRLQCPENLQLPPYMGISEEAWATFKTICPNASVELSLPINQDRPLETLRSIKKDMPLILLNFERKWPISDPPPEIVRIVLILNHLRGTQVHEGLETLRIHWYDVYEGLTEELAHYLILCTNLKSLELHICHPIRNFESLFRVCLRNHLMALKEYEIHIHRRINEDMTEYRSLAERYSPDFQARGVNLELETPND